MGTTKASAIRLKFEGELFAQRVNEELSGYLVIDHGVAFGQCLEQGLLKLGWKTSEAQSKCKTATFEAVLQKQRRIIHITSSVLLGAFTVIEAKSKES